MFSDEAIEAGVGDIYLNWVDDKLSCKLARAEEAEKQKQEAKKNEKKEKK